MRRKNKPIPHHADPAIDAQLMHIRALWVSAEYCKRQLDHWQDTLDKANKRRMMVGLDGLPTGAYEDITTAAAKAMPGVREEMTHYARQAEELTQALDVNDRAYL